MITNGVAPLIPDYASRRRKDRTEPLRKWPLVVALWCGALPLGVGIICFIFWLVSSWEIVALLGFLVMIAAVFLVPTGAGFLITYLVRSVRRRKDSYGGRWTSHRLKWMAAGALFGNLVCGYVFLRIGAYVDGLYDVTITNDSALPVDHLVLEASGITGLDEVEFEKLGRGETATRHIHLDSSTVLCCYTLLQNGSSSRGSLDLSEDDDAKSEFPFDLLVVVHDGGVKATRSPQGNGRQHLFPNERGRGF